MTQPPRQPPPNQPPEPTEPTATARAVQIAIVLAVAAAIVAWLDDEDEQASSARMLQAVTAALRSLYRVGAVVDRLLAGAYRGGARRAEQQLPAADRDRGQADDAEAKTAQPTRELTEQIEAAGRQVRRWAIQAHRDVLDEAARQTAAGEATRRQAAATAWRRILDRGATGFVDRAGRRWELASYVEMCVRTASAQAAVQGHVDRLVAAGYLHVVVSVTPSTCSKCARWGGRVLSLTRRGKHTVTLPSVLTGRPMRIEVAGSLAEAVDDGLLHPNCRHSLDPFLADVTKPRRVTAAHIVRGEQRDRQRYMERQVRKWKTREAAAFDPADKRAARTKARQWQSAIRAHTRETGLRRKPERERINTPR